MYSCRNKYMCFLRLYSILIVERFYTTYLIYLLPFYIHIINYKYVIVRKMKQVQ